MPAPDKHTILDALLPHIPFEGWNEAVLSRTCKTLGISEAEQRALLPHGVRDMVEYFVHQADEYMVSVLQQPDTQAMRMPERIRKAILARLAYLRPHKEAVRRALAFYALPFHAAHGLKLLHGTIDRLWHEAGDNALDFSYYTKRMSLSAIYSATLLVWLNDTSEEETVTAAFLDRRLEDIRRFTRFKRKMMG